MANAEPTPELPDALFVQVQAHCEAGDQYAQHDQFDEALDCYRQAWDLLPVPREGWSATLWLLSALGDVHYLRGDYSAAHDCLTDAVNVFTDEATANPFILLRLGQVEYELGRHEAAAQWLGQAFQLEGEQIFADEDPAYLMFLKSRSNLPGPT